MRIIWRAMISYTREWQQLIKYDPNVTPNQTNGILIMSLWFWNWEMYSLDGYIGVADISEVTEILIKEISMKANHKRTRPASHCLNIFNLYLPSIGSIPSLYQLV